MMINKIVQNENKILSYTFSLKLLYSILFTCICYTYAESTTNELEQSKQHGRRYAQLHAMIASAAENAVEEDTTVENAAIEATIAEATTAEFLPHIHANEQTVTINMTQQHTANIQLPLVIVLKKGVFMPVNTRKKSEQPDIISKRLFAIKETEIQLEDATLIEENPQKKPYAPLSTPKQQFRKRLPKAAFTNSKRNITSKPSEVDDIEKGEKTSSPVMDRLEGGHDQLIRRRTESFCEAEDDTLDNESEDQSVTIVREKLFREFEFNTDLISVNA